MIDITRGPIATIGNSDRANLVKLALIDGVSISN
jgi:hypothetical protein